MSKTLDPTGGPTARPLELLWLDPERMPRIRKRPPWRALLDEAEKPVTMGGDPPSPPLKLPAGDRGDPVLPNQKVPPADARDALVILARGEATEGEGVVAALEGGVRDDGKFAPPLVLVAGELRLPFDEIHALKAHVTTATPFVGGDEALKAAVDAAKEFLALPDLAPSPAVVEALIGRIREAFGRVKRAVPPGYLEAQTDRALLEQRRYQKRTFRGGPCLRALLQAGGDRGAMLVYLPESAAEKLPLYQRFGARLVAEAHLSVDQYETHPFALEALALARELPAPARR